MFRSILGRLPPGIPQSVLPSLVAKKEEPIVKMIMAIKGDQTIAKHIGIIPADITKYNVDPESLNPEEFLKQVQKTLLENEGKKIIAAMLSSSYSKSQQILDLLLSNEDLAELWLDKKIEFYDQNRLVIFSKEDFYQPKEIIKFDFAAVSDSRRDLVLENFKNKIKKERSGPESRYSPLHGFIYYKTNFTATKEYMDLLRDRMEIKNQAEEKLEEFLTKLEKNEINHEEAQYLSQEFANQLLERSPSRFSNSKFKIQIGNDHIFEFEIRESEFIPATLTEIEKIEKLFQNNKSHGEVLE